MAAVFSYGGRPCLQVGDAQKKRHPKFGCYFVVQVRYLDGKQPAAEPVSRGKFEKAKAIRGPQAEVWIRADQLVREGMDADRAVAQATAELTKGILIPGGYGNGTT